MKKFRIKYKFILLLILVLLVFLSPYMFINIKLIGDKKMVLNYGEKYSEPGYRTKIFGKNVTQKTKVTNSVKENIGTYKVTYSYKFLFYNINKQRTIIVKDIEKPKLKLNEGNIIETTINENFVDPGYTVTDNKDGDLTQKVNVTGKIDTTKLGEYQLKYEVSDNSGNKIKKVRTVKVVNKSPLKMSISEYSLNGWYDEVKLKKTNDYGNEYFDKITMVGDSNTMNMYLSGYLKGIRAWAIPCLHASTMHTWDINLYGLGIKTKLIDAVKQYKPETIILNLGTFSTTWIEETEFLEKANAIIEQIKKESPNTNLVLISLYPITKNGANINSFSQQQINKYNYLILKLASEHKLKYLDVQEVLKDSTGYGNPSYYAGDCFHLNNLGHSVVKEYIKTHGLEEEL